MSHNFHITPEDGIARPCSGKCIYGDNVISGDTAEEAQYNHAVSKGLDKVPSLKKQKDKLTDDTEISEESLRELIDEYGLDAGNAEISETDTGTFVYFEAPNHATLKVEVTDVDNIGEFKEYILQDLEEFDAGDALQDGLEGGIIYNDMDIDDAREKVEEDKIFFNEVAQRLRGELNLDNSSGSGDSAAISEDNINDLLEEYDLDFGNSEIIIDEDDDEITVVVESHNNSTVVVRADKNATVGELKRKILDEVESFDAEEQFDETWNHRIIPGDVGAGQVIMSVQADEEHFTQVGAKLRKDLGLPAAPKPYSPNITKHHEPLKDSYSEIANDETISVSHAEQLLEDYELSHGNAETFEQGDELYITFEAPDNSTMGISIDKNSSLSQTRETIVGYMEDFSASTEFSDIWSEEFGEHNGFSAFEFMKKLQSDEAYFKDTAKKIRRDIKNL